MFVHHKWQFSIFYPVKGNWVNWVSSSAAGSLWEFKSLVLAGDVIVSIEGCQFANISGRDWPDVTLYWRCQDAISSVYRKNLFFLTSNRLNVAFSSSKHRGASGLATGSWRTSSFTYTPMSPRVVANWLSIAFVQLGTPKWAFSKANGFILWTHLVKKTEKTFWKGEALSKPIWKLIGWTSCHSKWISYTFCCQLNQVATAWGFILVRGTTFDALPCR